MKKLINRLREPSTYIGLGGVAAAFPGIIGGVGVEKAEIARQGLETVATGLSTGLGFFPSLLLALGGSLAAILGERRD